MGASSSSANSSVKKPKDQPPSLNQYYQKGVRRALRRVRDLRAAFAELKHNPPNTDDFYGKQTYRIGEPYQTLWLHGTSPVFVDTQGRLVGKYSSTRATRATYDSPQARAFAAGFESVSRPVNALLDVLDPSVPGTTTNFVGPPDIVRE